jgi:hypothetical protein
MVIWVNIIIGVAPVLTPIRPVLGKAAANLLIFSEKSSKSAVNHAFLMFF